MTVPDPTGQPDIERPIDLTDTPERDDPRSAPAPDRRPDEGGSPDETGAPPPNIEPAD